MKVILLFLVASFVHTGFSARCPTCQDCAHTKEELVECKLSKKNSVLKITWNTVYTTDSKYVCVDVVFPKDNVDYHLKECAVGSKESICQTYFKQYGKDKVFCEVVEAHEDVSESPFFDDPGLPDAPSLEDLSPAVEPNPYNEPPPRTEPYLVQLSSPVSVTRGPEYKSSVESSATFQIATALVFVLVILCSFF